MPNLVPPLITHEEQPVIGGKQGETDHGVAVGMGNLFGRAAGDRHPVNVVNP